MAQDSIEVGPNGETVSVGEEFEVIASPPNLPGGNQLSVGDTIKVVRIETGLPNGSEVVIDSKSFRFSEQNVSPTTVGEALGVVEYKNNPEQSIQRL